MGGEQALDKKGIGTGGAIVIVAIIALIFVVAFVDLMTCPTCRGIPVVQYVCPTCGGDGKITVLQYILEVIEGQSVTIMPHIQLPISVR